jgi:hypothetical protein
MKQTITSRHMQLHTQRCSGDETELCLNGTRFNSRPHYCPLCVSSHAGTLSLLRRTLQTALDYSRAAVLRILFLPVCNATIPIFLRRRESSCQNLISVPEVEVCGCSHGHCCSGTMLTNWTTVNPTDKQVTVGQYCFLADRDVCRYEGSLRRDRLLVTMASFKHLRTHHKLHFYSQLEVLSSRTEQFNSIRHETERIK